MNQSITLHLAQINALRRMINLLDPAALSLGTIYPLPFSVCLHVINPINSFLSPRPGVGAFYHTIQLLRTSSTFSRERLFQWEHLQV